MTYSTTTTPLTEKENQLVTEWLVNIDSCARNPRELLGDNFSCMTITDLQEFSNFTEQQIAGLISALYNKCVVLIESRNVEKLPDLYWLADEWLEELDPTIEF